MEQSNFIDSVDFDERVNRKCPGGNRKISGKIYQGNEKLKKKEKEIISKNGLESQIFQYSKVPPAFRPKSFQFQSIHSFSRQCLLGIIQFIYSVDNIYNI